ncbi:hypothetical protein HOY80DRAFT_945688 [Tuber brumale]|nr:hypothetical protein HOY80DRAFT_945688 [Tuber brumale]
MSNKTKYSYFFKANKHPRDWGIVEYLNYDHGKLSPRKVLDGWQKSLETIIECTDQEFSQSRRKRAAELLKRYKEKGKGSDRLIGREWLSNQTKQQKKPSLVNIGAVFNGAVTSSSVPITQTTCSQPSQANEVEDSDDHEAMDAPVESVAVDEEYEDEDYETPTPEQPRKNRSIPASFYNAYNEMASDCKWVLASGRAVEDVIFNTSTAMDTATFAHSLSQSFVLDTSDPVMKSWFTEDEWNEIIASVLPLPKPDAVLADSLKRFFPVKSTTMLREVLDKQGYLPEGVSYDSKIHYNSQWADVVIRRFLMLLEAPGEPLRTSHLEDWYSSYVWSSILDDSLLNLPGMTVERKESPCRATSLRKNRRRQKLSTRMKLGSRLDAIIRTSEDDYHEYGAMEVARTFTGGVTSTKWLGDAFKLVKALRDMLPRLHELVNGDAEITRRVQVVGVCTAGLALQYVRLGHPGIGHVCLLKREGLVQVPKGVGGGLAELLKVLMTVAQLKEVVRVSAEAVEERHIGKSEVDLYEELVGGKAGGEARLGWAIDTP